MKVVLFCGGKGTRLGSEMTATPKPLVKIGTRPIVWHLMKYYAHFGHKEFILCCGWQGQAIKEYFLNYNECISNDFVMANGGQSIECLNTDISDWRITFVDSGENASIGERLMKVRRFVDKDERFLANYADGLSDVALPDMIERSEQTDAVATCIAVKPRASFHLLGLEPGGAVRNIQPLAEAELWINGGYFVFKREIFDYMNDGEDLVEEPFERLSKAGKLQAHVHNGFWACLDTFKDRQLLEEMDRDGQATWKIWQSAERAAEKPSKEHAHARA
ncbi:MAG: sugar phosphate nucleotidyltransferase [Bryobacterales bacterium]